jgi:alpha-1,6-mannosyltransferase
LIIKQHKSTILFVLLSIVFYLSFAYDLNRNDYIKLVTLYSGLFIAFYNLILSNKPNFKFLTILAIGLRSLFLISTPNLSQDFYRFIWDGRMIIAGFNPYLFTPESFIIQDIFPIHQALELYNGMGILNGSHFTNYPPLNQFCFVIAGIFSGKSVIGSVVIMRLIIISADLGTLYFGKRLLQKLNIPIHHIFWYILNPFIIIELSGNLHFEGVMIFFLVWTLYLLHLNKWKLAGFTLACSISVKLIPLIFLPLLLKHLHWRKSIVFYMIVFAASALTFLPFITVEFITNYYETVGLWFQRFEFNASLYYIARAIGYTFRGYNEIAIIGKMIPFIVILFVLGMTFFRRNKSTIDLTTSMLFVLSFYFFTATTVHPWYVATLLILSVFTKYKFPLVWSFIGILSYLAYTNADNTENLWIISLEYAVIYGVLFWDIFINKKTMILKS